jgi:hypothetical protein
MYRTFYGCGNLTGTIPNIPNSVTSMDYTFSYCSNLTGTIPNIPNSVTRMYYTFVGCSNLTGTIPNIPNSVTNMYGTFEKCSNITGDVYIHSNNVTTATRCFINCSNYHKNIYVYEGTTTWNTFYQAMGNSTTNANWNATLNPIRDNMTVTIELDTESSNFDADTIELSLWVEDPENDINANVPVYLIMRDGEYYISLDPESSSGDTSVTFDYPKTNYLTLKHVQNNADDVIGLQAIYVDSIEDGTIDATELVEEYDSDSTFPNFEGYIYTESDNLIIRIHADVVFRGFPIG